MIDARPFHFKHFSLYHHRSTMKVGTDAVLLGRWVEVRATDYVLDIGTGCGILPLMLAQKGVAHVDAVDIDEASFEEAKTNFEASQWRDLLQAYCTNIVDFQTDKRYDLIVSNPPFFSRSYKCEADRKNRARHTDESLPYASLCQEVGRLLKADGRFALVLPLNEPNRVNLELGFSPCDVVKEEMFVIRGADNHFTQQYTEFLKDYYLG